MIQNESSLAQTIYVMAENNSGDLQVVKEIKNALVKKDAGAAVSFMICVSGKNESDFELIHPFQVGTKLSFVWAPTNIEYNVTVVDYTVIRPQVGRRWEFILYVM